MLINGIFEILGVGSPPVLPCSRATVCCQCVCALVTQHPTPWCRPTLILKLRLMGQCSELPRGMGQTSPFVAWNTLLKRANTILKLTGVCLLLESQSGHSEGSDENEQRIRRQPSRLAQAQTTAWIRPALTPGARYCLPSVWGFICQGDGQAAKGPLRWGVVQPDCGMLPHQMSTGLSEGALGWDSGGWVPRGGPSWAPWVWATHSPVPSPQALCQQSKGMGSIRNSHRVLQESHRHLCV